MKNKGFTLIELLAVIVILAVISLIAVPMILGVIEDSRKSSFKVTCNEIYDSYEQYEVNEELQGSKAENVIFEFGSNRTEREEVDGTVYEPISKLNLKGELPKMGTYKILKDTRELVVSDDKYTCIRDGKRNEVLNGSIADNDITNPILKGISLSSTTNSIKVIADAEEPDGMIVKYYYKINGKETISESNNQVYTGLEKNKEYEIEVIVENKSGLKSETIKEKITTKEMNNPEIKQISETPGEYEYATSRVIQIGYDKQEEFQYYLKSSVEAEVVGNTIVSTCGTETIPGNCTESNVTTIEANTWYETSNTTPSVVYKQNGTLYALTSDGTNVSGTSTYTVTKIDTENPNVEVSVTGKTATFTFSDNVGILSYGVNQSNTEEPSYIETNELTGNYEASSAGTYYVWVKDKAGNKINKTFEIDKNAFGFNITYQVDNNQYVELIPNGKSALTPSSFTPSKSGYTFVGWREDNTATSSVLTSKTVQGSSFTLYAVFKRTLTANFNGNGATGGSTGSVSGIQYYNNGNVANPTITLPSNGFVKANNTFTGWNYGAVGTKVTLTDNITVIAQWTQAIYNYGYTGGMQSFVAPVTGTYQLEVWGAQGGNNNGASDRATPGYGGYAAGYVSLTKGQVIYICVGENGNRAIRQYRYTYNGGGRAYDAPGGGATHIGTRNGTLREYGNTSGLFIVAGGGGGAGAGHSPNGGVLGHGYQGGSGGGASGGYGYAQHYAGDNYEGGAGGTQSRSPIGYNGGFGYGGWNSNSEYLAAGGGGLYGGAYGREDSEGAWTAGGGGGSGYIGGVTNGSMQSGVRAGDGYARITLISAN